MKRLFAGVAALLYLLACASAHAQTTLETFETQTPNAASFVSGGVTFDIVSRSGGTFDIQAQFPGTGWNGSANDNRYIDNSGSAAAGQNVDFSLRTRDGSRFSVERLWLYLANQSANVNVSGSVTVTGKLAGATVFTATGSSGFATTMTPSNGFSLIDLTVFGGGNNAAKLIDELAVATGGQFVYVALDALSWTRSAATYAITTSVSPGGAGTLSCTPNPVNSGSTASCTATPNSGFVFDSISGCGLNTTTGPGPFTTAAVTANCSVTATFVAALAANITTNTAPSCNGGSNGLLTVTASGGTPPYVYSWSPTGGTGATASALAAGTYSVQVTDNRGRVTATAAVLSQPTAVAISTASLPDGIAGQPYSQSVAASGGTGALSYSLGTPNNLPPGLTLSSSGAVSGTPTTTGAYTFQIVARDANTCPGARTFSSTIRASVGGTVSGLAAASSVTVSLNGTPLTLNSNGPFTFSQALDSGASYSVAVVSQTAPQLCTLRQASGVIGTGSVGNVAVECTTLALSVTPALVYLGAGDSADFLVRLDNTGAARANNIALTGVLSAAFDTATLQWQCLDGDASATCAASGSGSFADTANLPGGRHLTWAVNVALLPGAPESGGTFGVTTAPGGHSAQGQAVRVLFRDGFDTAPVQQLDGAAAGAVLQAGATLALLPSPGPDAAIVDLVTLRAAMVARVQQRWLDGLPYLRLHWRTPLQGAQVSPWSRAAADGRAAIGSLAVDAAQRVLLLDGTQPPLRSDAYAAPPQ
ncbi:putative Ig domain-containing protein [Tahibacter harae]|uniref:Bacterial repeat domain-containing protein n=1 Tax=Tahibacter harae TaxID=2963937 RepID=A0ABT1QZ54_9GAMM|nr:putative Ig domain-containing protein [Tahibacter harae]MCQ4167569.1 hypothetical protein [Tahibacter harae]